MRVGVCLLGVAAVLSGCSQPTFQCADDSACVVEGIAGSCEGNGYCSFPDEECSSGRRFGQEAPAEFGGICVGSDGSSGSGSTSTTSAASTGPATTLPELTSDASSTGPGAEADSSDEGGSSVTGESTGPSPNVVFVSSAAMSPADVTPASADAFCSQLATDAGLSGSYVAWISTDDEDAVERLGGARGWVRPDGQPFVDRQTDLIEGRVLYPPVLDENGNPKRGRIVLTGTGSDGAGTSANCQNWTDFTDGYYTFGRPGGGAELWSGTSSIRNCEDPAPVHLYCFGVDLTIPVEYQPVEGRFAFVTQAEVMGNIGIDAFDALCNQEAGGGGLPGTYKALVATDASSAFDRFDTSGAVWVNTLGVPLAESAGALPELAHLEAAPSLTAVGEVVGGEYWTGASSPSSVSGNTCSDWTAIDGLGDFYYAAATTDWFDAPAHNCDASDRLLCLQE